MCNIVPPFTMVDSCAKAWAAAKKAKNKAKPTINQMKSSKPPPLEKKQSTRSKKNLPSQAHSPLDPRTELHTQPRPKPRICIIGPKASTQHNIQQHDEHSPDEDLRTTITPPLSDPLELIEQENDAVLTLLGFGGSKRARYQKGGDDTGDNDNYSSEPETGKPQPKRSHICIKKSDSETRKTNDNKTNKGDEDEEDTEDGEYECSWVLRYPWAWTYTHAYRHKLW